MFLKSYEKRKWAWGIKMRNTIILLRGRIIIKEIENRGSRKVAGNQGEFLIIKAKGKGFKKKV